MESRRNNANDDIFFAWHIAETKDFSPEISELVADYNQAVDTNDAEILDGTIEKLISVLYSGMPEMKEMASNVLVQIAAVRPALLKKPMRNLLTRLQGGRNNPILAAQALEMILVQSETTSPVYIRFRLRIAGRSRQDEIVLECPQSAKFCEISQRLVTIFELDPAQKIALTYNGLILQPNSTVMQAGITKENDLISVIPSFTSTNEILNANQPQGQRNVETEYANAVEYFKKNRLIQIKPWGRSITHLSVNIIGGEETNYANQNFLFEIKLGETYPSDPPYIYCHTLIQHPGIVLGIAPGLPNLCIPLLTIDPLDFLNPNLVRMDATKSNSKL